MVFVKICGITDLEGARAAVDAGADALGFNFWRPGRRYITPERAGEIIAALDCPTVWKFGVFVDEDAARVLEIARRVGLTALQLHGGEKPCYLETLGGFHKWKAFRVDGTFVPHDVALYPANAYLLDAAGATPGGTGAAFDWSIAAETAEFGRVVVAGGLTPENVAQAIREARPWGLDVAGGVESAPGKKDVAKVRRFIAAVRAVENG